MFTIKTGVIILSTILLTSCAKFVPPTGGDKDVTPPKLIESTPINKQLYFRGKQLTLIFDELVDTKTLKQELTITPESNGRYKIKNRGEVVELEFEEDFADSTTYTLSFGAGIKDLNEQNKSDNLKLVFSTGSELDSLKITGNAKNLFDKEGLLGATVAIYKMSSPDTLPLINRKPDYFTKTDSSGNFELENLKSDTYRILAFTDKNGNKKFDNKKELFGFVRDTLNLDENKNGIPIELYPYDTIAPKYKRYIQREKTYTLAFDEPIFRAEVNFENDSIPYTIIEDEIRFFKVGSPIDSLQISLIVQDSLLNSDTLRHKITFREADQRSKQTTEPLRITLTPANSSPITPNQPLLFSFNIPLAGIDTTKLTVSDDTLGTVKFKTRFKNNSRTEVELLLLNAITTSLVIEAEKGAFINILLDSSSVFKLKNPLQNSNELGLIAGAIQKDDSLKYGQYIIQLLNTQRNKIAKELISKDGKFLFENIRPDEYSIRVIVDSNSNGIWDTANFAKGLQPERVILFRESIKVKANFEFRDINIPNQ
ncbi:MAG: Ig-like domain-containing protein [Spirosomaceae bacterium]|nr:Ig-like domain-containing protein [Spirosomataceae bacterium]